MQEVERTEARQVALLDGGREAYPAMLAAIAAARREIFLEAYHFAPDGIGAEFIAALSAAARRGVEVRLVVAGWAASSPRSSRGWRGSWPGAGGEERNRDAAGPVTAASSGPVEAAPRAISRLARARVSRANRERAVGGSPSGVDGLEQAPRDGSRPYGFE